MRGRVAFVTLLLIGASIGWSADASVVRAADVKPLAQPRVGAAAVAVTSEGGYNGFPEALRLPNGVLHVYYTHGEYHGGPSTGLLRSSTDEGRTWSASRAVGTIRSPIALADGTILAASTSSVASGTEGRRPASTRSRDGGVTWTSDGLAAGGAGFTGQALPFSLVRLPDGSILMSVGGHDAAAPGSWYLRYLRSNDGGRTWSILSTLRPATGSYLEPSLAVGLDGRILSAFRVDSGTDGTIHMAESTDRGQTWSAPRPVFAHASGFPRLVVLADGSVLCMYRSVWTDFNPLRYGRSVDGGATWTFGLDFTGADLREMMNGAWLPSKDGRTLGVVYALEKDWYRADTYYRQLDVPASGIEVRGMTRQLVWGVQGTSVRVTGRVVWVAADGSERRLPGVKLTFSLRSFDPNTGASIADRAAVSSTDASGNISVVVPVGRHGELAMYVDGMPASAPYWVGTFRAKPVFITCPTSQVASPEKTYWVYCQAPNAPGFGAEFQRLTLDGWVHQKSAWADSTGMFKTPVTVTAATSFRVTIWQTTWTDRAWSPVIVVSVR